MPPPKSLPLYRPPTREECTTCGGKCCSLAAFTMGEYKLVRKKGLIPRDAVIEPMRIRPGRHRKVVQGGPGILILAADAAVPGLPGFGRCAFLVLGQCSIYKDRPDVCRDYASRDELPCMYIHPEAAKDSMLQMMRDDGIPIPEGGSP